MNEYEKFLLNKKVEDVPTGITGDIDINDMLFDFQRDIVKWALRRGRACIFSDCGTGKTPMQLEWAKHITEHTGGDVLIVAPLAVSAQTIREGDKFGIKVNKADQKKDGISITNYEQLHKFSRSDFAGIVIDESSILKSFTGKFRNHLINEWGQLEYKLACTATPAPNDYMELGSHSEFTGIMRSSEMLASFFINDPANVGKYRVKGHANSPFWKWMSSWAVMIRKPSDLGYDDGAFKLPKLDIIDIITDSTQPPGGMLFSLDAHTMLERKRARKASIVARVEEVARIANSTTEPFLVWCDLNSESAMLTKAINGAVEVKGADKPEQKEKNLLGFSNGDFRVLVSKPSIAGWGMNYQHCHNMAFTGLSDSYEQFYQAVRRCWRFGQTECVKCYVVTDRTEGAVVSNIKRKELAATQMADNMTQNMSYISRGEIVKDISFKTTYKTTKEMEIPSWLNV